jgi:hypothetical protein
VRAACSHQTSCVCISECLQCGGRQQHRELLKHAELCTTCPDGRWWQLEHTRNVTHQSCISTCPAWQEVAGRLSAGVMLHSEEALKNPSTTPAVPAKQLLLATPQSTPWGKHPPAPVFACCIAVVACVSADAKPACIGHGRFGSLHGHKLVLNGTEGTLLCLRLSTQQPQQRVCICTEGGA